ncbi:MAG: thioredoxin family protein [Planctomycetes bacterium]|nr:thioredoxin family protein [Planctomycetota bacterium]MBL7143057.1 thioredoxin family protein [Phycisphaerae bacterium]
MKSKKTLLLSILWTAYIFAITCSASGQNTNDPVSIIAPDNAAGVELASSGQEVSTVRIEPVQMDSKAGIAVLFEGTDDLHYYAKSETAPAEGLELKIQAHSDVFSFGEAVFPQWHLFTDPLGSKIEVYEGNFTIFVPIKETRVSGQTTVIDKGDIEVKITGIACTSKVCLPPFEKTLQTKIDWSERDSWKSINIEAVADKQETITAPSYSIPFALGLAFLAGLTLNIMPCVWPVLPLIVMRIVEQAKAGKKQSQAMGFAFCCGILLFFASLAIANIILQIFYGTVLQWGDQYRNPVFVAGMVLLLVVLALLMFGVFNIGVPSSIAGKSSGKGYSGAVGTGFLAAILSTPCGFGILAFAFGWAQAQHWLVATVVIMVIGVGMAVPYAILTSIPGLLKRLPKPGQWMELFKQGIGFVLLIIAVKLIGALPQAYRTNVLYFAVILGFCIWMWGGWVSFNTKPGRKWLIRISAGLIVFAGGWVFLPTPAGELIAWQDYDDAVIDNAIAEGKPVLIKFTADWCLSCQAVDKVVYHNEDIAGLIEAKEVLAIKADTTANDNPATLALKNKYNELVPVTILFLPGVEEPLRLHEIFFTGRLKEILQELPSKK